MSDFNNVENEELLLILDISDRALGEDVPLHVKKDMARRIACCHSGPHPLDLMRLLKATDADFWGDINGIMKNMNATTGEMENGFRPFHARW